jgi:predicted ribosome quality control (RQC) complex YloA/Tae2 family protein
MELSGIELRYLVNEIKKKICNGYYVSNVNGITRDSIQLKLHHPTEPDILLIISDKGIWISTLKFDSIEQGNIVNVLRNEILRAKIDNVEQFGSERIVILKFVLDQIRYLIAEFFAGGNIILCNESMKILAILNPIEVRHRVLKAGIKYAYPPKRGIDVLDLQPEDMKKLRSSDLDVARWIGRNIALPKKFVEEVIRSSSIDLNAKGTELSEKDVNTLYNKIVNLVADVCDGNHKPVLVMQDNIAVDASPLPLQNLPSAEPVGSYMEAVDAVLSNYLRKVGESIKSGRFEDKISELERALEEQKRAKETLLEKSKFMRNFADQLMNLTRSGANSIADSSVKELMAKTDVTFEEEHGSTILNITGEKITIKNTKIPSLVSTIYNRAKELENGIKSIDDARDKLMKELESVKQQSEIAKQKVKVKQQASKEWYERYRWFFTTDGLLAVGGRDASSNSAVVRRHLTDNDIVFHAEIHGSPFFILKTAKGDESCSINEVAQATASFSRAWKEGLATTDAYWVHAEQIKKAAPSGQFLPKGSFVIEGKRNYIKGLELKLAVGLVKTKQAIKVMAGPPDSVKRNSLVYVLIMPDSLNATDTAKKIKVEFVTTADAELAELAKDLNLDDIIRVLPSGGCKVVQASAGDNIDLQQND